MTKHFLHPTKRDIVVFCLTFVFDVAVWEGFKRLIG